MKKLFTLLFVFLIILTFSLTAFASEAVQNDERIAEVVEGEDNVTEYESVFDTVAGFVAERSAEILSFMTFIGSLIIAFTYKKGLLPNLSSALSGIGGSVGRLTEKTERSIDEISEKVDAVCREGENTERICLSLSESVGNLSDKLNEIKGDKGEIQSFKLILSSQVDMLYEIFMSSALPQYSKDAVFEKISAMRTALSEDGKNNV